LVGLPGAAVNLPNIIFSLFYHACLKAEVEPRYEKWNGQGSLTDFVVAQNLERRHLTSTQKALLALKLEPMYATEAKERKWKGVKPDLSQIIDQGSDNGGKAATQAAKAVGSNRQYVSDLKKMEKEEPELRGRRMAKE
jgi:hypothetical protein